MKEQTLQKNQYVLWAVFTAGLLLSLLSTQVALNLENETLKVEQQRITDLVSDSLSKELEINKSILSSIRGLFIASDHVNRNEFKLFTQYDLNNHPSIQALEWIPLVSHEKREQFQQLAIQDGLQNYAIKERNSAGKMVSAKPRKDYFPVYYVEPMQGNEAAAGFDLASSSKRLKSLSRARETGQAQVTDSITLVQDTTNQKGFLIVQPIFKTPETGNKTVDLTFSGFALGVFSIGDLFETATSPLLKQIAPLHLVLTDITNAQQVDLLHNSSESPIKILETGTDWRMTQIINFANRTWQLKSYSTDDFKVLNRKNTHWFVFFTGLFLTLLITGYLRALMRRESDIKTLVTQRTHELSISEKMNRTIIENAVDAVITINPDGIVQLFSPAAETMFGYTSQQVIGQNIKMLMPEPYRSEHDGYLEHHRETGETKIIGIGREVRGQHKDGSTFPMNLSVGKAQIDKTTLYIGTVSDLTMVKRKERALQDFSERLDLATRSASIGVWDYDVAKGTLNWDKRMFKLYGISKDQFPGAYQAWHNALHPDDLDRAEAELNEAIEGGKQFDTEFRINWPDGEERHIKASAVVLFDQQKKAQRMTGVNIDITEQKRIEQALFQAKQAAESANRQKSAFLNTMSHELRTPLTVILGYLPLLKNSDNPLPAESVIQIAEDMDISGQHLLEMINDLLDISKIEAGQMDLNLEQIEALPLINEILRKFDHQAKQKGLQLINNITDFSFKVDGRRLKQILINLIGNALKFTRSGAITISAKLNDEFVTISVTDTGMGIPESALPYIFDTFRQVDDSSTRDTGGSGLGLAITKRLVELHGGSITVSSDHGSGTTFTFSIKR